MRINPSSPVAFLFTALIALLPVFLPAAVPPAQIDIRYTGLDFEGRQTYQFQWNAKSNATYFVQTAGALTATTPWKTVDVVIFTNDTGQYTVKGRSIPENAEFLRLVLPRPEISAVEPAVFASDGATEAWVIGQCFETNDLVHVDGVTVGIVTYISSSLLHITLPPLSVGPHLVEIVHGGVAVSAFTVTNMGELPSGTPFVQEPPTEPVASPQRNSQGNRGAVIQFDVVNARSHGTGPNGQGLRISGNGQAQVFETDISIPGRGLDFVWARTYNSRMGRAGAANGWTFSYDVNLQPLGGDILIHDGSGRADIFKPNTNGVYTCPEFFCEGTLTGGVFRLTFADSGYWQFNPIGGSPAGGKLAFIVDRNGNTMSLNYDGAGRLAAVVDDLGRTNTMAYNPGGQLAAVTDFSGRTVTYQYCQGIPADRGGAGDLASVTSPPVSGTPNGNDFPSGKTTTYSYTKGFPPALDAQNHLLLSIEDALGQTTAQFSYDLNSAASSYLSCVAVQRSTNTATMISYRPQTPTPASHFAMLCCIVNDPVGNVTECFLDARHRVVMQRDFTGRAIPGTAVTDTLNRPAGKLRPTDPDFYECRATWNNDSLCRRLYLYGGEQLECVYESDFDKSTRPRKRADLRVLREIAASGVDLDGDGVVDTTERVWRYQYNPLFGSRLAGEDELGDEAGDPEAYSSFVAVPDRARRRLVLVSGSSGSSSRMGMGKGMYEWIQARSGFVISATDPRGDSSTGEYDTQGNLLEAKSTGFNGGFNGGIVQTSHNFGYNAQGQLTATTNAPDATGYRRVDTFDYYASGPQAGYLHSVVIDDRNLLGLRLTTSYECDARGNITRCIDARTNDWLYTWNALDQCVRVQTPVNLIARSDTDFYYDANDNCFQVTGQLRDATDNLVTTPTDYFRFDPLHRLTQIECAVDATHSRTNAFSYDGNDQCVLARDGDAVSGVDPHQAVAYEYDERGMLFREIGAPGSGVSPTNEWSYTINGSPATKKYVDSQETLTTTFTYDGFEAFGKAINTKPLTGTANLATALGKAINTKPLTGTANRVTELGKAINTKPLTGTANRTSLGKAINTKPLTGTANLATALGKAINTKPLTSTANRVTALGKAINTKPLTGTANRRGDRVSLVGFGSFSPASRLRVWQLMQGQNGTAAMRIAKITDPMGNTTTFNYDACDNLKVVREFGELNDVVGAAGNIRLAESRYEYDGLDRCVRAHDLFFDVATQTPLGDGAGTTTFAYATNGQCTTITDDLGRVTSRTYDTVGWLGAISSSSGKAIVTTVRDSEGNALSHRRSYVSDLGGPPQVFAETNVYDSLNRCVSRTDNMGNTTTCAFDSFDRVVKTTDPRGIATFYVYDLLGRQTLEVRDLNGDGTPSLAYDVTAVAAWSSSSPRLLATTDSNQHTTSYAYDSLNRCTNITQADGTQSKLVWSPQSNLLQEQDANGTIAFHTYDLNDRCVSNHYVLGPGVAGTTTFEQFTYDGCSQLMSASNDGSACAFVYDSLGACTRDTSAGQATSATFDALGNRLSLTYPGGRALTYAYDELNRCTNVLESGLSLGRFEYDGPDRVARVTYGNGMRARILYDGSVGSQNQPGDFGWGQVSAITHALAGGVPRVAAVEMKWDRAGNKISRAAVTLTPQPQTNTITLTYDNADRLVNSLVMSGTTLVGFAGYDLDRMGNRTNVAGTACSGDYLMDATIPPADFQMNQYTVTPCDTRSYDENGNLAGRTVGTALLSYSYDCCDRLVTVTGSGGPVALYAYDAVGRRIAKTVFGGAGTPPETTQFYYDGDRLIEAHPQGVLPVTYVSPPCNGLGTCLTMRRNGQDYFFHCDDQGNALALTTTGGAVAEQYAYDDYGAVTFLTSDGVPASATSSSVGNPFLYHGREWDNETGWHYAGAGSAYMITYKATQGKTGKASSPKRVVDPHTGRGLTRGDASSGAFADNNPWSEIPMFRKMIPVTVPDITGAQRMNSSGMTGGVVASSGGSTDFASDDDVAKKTDKSDAARSAKKAGRDAQLASAEEEEARRKRRGKNDEE